METILVELSFAMALLGLGAIALPLAARLLERESLKSQAFFVPSILSLGITMIFAVGLSLLMAAAGLASGNAGWAIMGLGAIGFLVMIKLGWKLLREPHSFEPISGPHSLVG